MAMPNTPWSTEESEKAPEVMALVQPNSSNIGLKKTPKTKYKPHETTMIKKAPATTI
jgi:hypothetical protein